MKKLLFIPVMLLASCYNNGKESVTTNNPDYDVELLFEADGCRVYRFMDGGNYRYFTNCSGNIQWEEGHGKNGHTVIVSTN